MVLSYLFGTFKTRKERSWAKMKKTGLMLVGALIIGGMVTTGVVMAAGNGNACNGNGTPGTPGNCQMIGQQGQMGKGQGKMAQTIATLANKPVDEVVKAKQPGETWLKVAEKYGVKQEQIQQENMKQNQQNGGNCNGPCQNGTNNAQTK
jgi:hypothetical protein